VTPRAGLFLYVATERAVAVRVVAGGQSLPIASREGVDPEVLDALVREVATRPFPRPVPQASVVRTELFAAARVRSEKALNATHRVLSLDTDGAGQWVISRWVAAPDGRGLTVQTTSTVADAKLADGLRAALGP